MRTKIHWHIFYFFSVGIMAVFLSCSSKERKVDENLLRVDKSALHYSKPLVEKDLPIYDPKLVFFEFNKSLLKPEAKKALIPTAQFLKEDPNIRVVIEGYCDERGSDEYNMKLGLRRAEAVKEFLLKRGIPSERVQAVSYGRILGSGEKNWAQNRRVGFQVIYQ